MNKMKLIATDMDGTLLKEGGVMPESAFDLIDRLQAVETKFAVASGRQYRNLFQVYAQIKDKIIVIAENGGFVFDEGKLISSKPIARADGALFVSETRKLNDRGMIMICGLDAGYIFREDAEKSERYKTFSEGYFPVLKVIETYEDIPESETIGKFTILDYEGEMPTYEAGLAHLKDRLQVIVVATNAIDVMAHGVNKGDAIKEIQKLYGITPEETMVFGDHFNDLEMMGQAHYSYAMANALPEVKAVANFEAPSNEEEGVIQVIEAYLNGTLKKDVSQ